MASTIDSIFKGGLMAKKSKLNQVAENIGSAMGKADRTAHKVARNIGSAMDRADQTAKKVAKAGSPRAQRTDGDFQTGGCSEEAAAKDDEEA